jgi:hypothetical protein
MIDVKKPRGKKVAESKVAEPVTVVESVTEVKEVEPKEKKARAPMSDEAKAAAAAKRKATLEAKKASASGSEAEAEVKAKAEPKAKAKAKAKAEPKVESKAEAKAPEYMYELTDTVSGGFFMVHKVTKRAYRADLNMDGDERALLDQDAGLFKDGEILPIFDEDE